MTFPTFTPPRPPQLGSSKETDQRVLSAEFGDGYEQVVADGLNSIRDICRLQWNGVTNAESAALETFWNQVGKTGVFLYKFPGDTVTKKWRFDSPLTINWVSGEINSIQVSIRQVFDLG
jgi:phage-related protein